MRLKTFYLIITACYLILTIGFLAAGSFGFLVLSNNQGVIAEQSYRLTAMAERESILSSLSDKFEKLKADLSLINIALPAEKESSKLVADLDSLANASGLKLTLIQSATTGKKATSEDPSLLQTVKGSYGYEIPLEIKVEGSFASFTGFMKQIENYQRLLNVTSLEITKPDNDNPTADNIEAKLKITAYLKK